MSVNKNNVCINIQGVSFKITKRRRDTITIYIWHMMIYKCNTSLLLRIKYNGELYTSCTNSAIFYYLFFITQNNAYIDICTFTCMKLILQKYLEYTEYMSRNHPYYIIKFFIWLSNCKPTLKILLLLLFSLVWKIFSILWKWDKMRKYLLKRNDIFYNSVTVFM